ncbi:uncharacterized protein V1510DRAFT_411729 [Dipodascopsis tothii]|uniref:uncharacterized protein n=1 Tax=Dipodascopsis tothii TaxID=44089 RepID=UPI0034CFC9DB
MARIRSMVGVALEWSELAGPVVLGLRAELDECARLADDLSKGRPGPGEQGTGKHVDVDALLATLDQKPAGRLATVTDDDKAQGLALEKLGRKLAPLKISLELLASKMKLLAAPMNEHFPAAYDELAADQAELETRFARLTTAATDLQRELGEDRWAALLHVVGQQARADIAVLDRAATAVRDAIQYSLNGTDSPTGRRHVEAYERQAVALRPRIRRTIELFLRSIGDRVTVSGDVIREYMQLTTLWKELDAPEPRRKRPTSAALSKDMFEPTAPTTPGQQKAPRLHHARSAGNLRAPPPPPLAVPPLPPLPSPTRTPSPARSPLRRLKSSVELRPARDLHPPLPPLPTSKTSITIPAPTTTPRKSRKSLIPTPARRPKEPLAPVPGSARNVPPPDSPASPRYYIKYSDSDRDTPEPVLPPSPVPPPTLTPGLARKKSMPAISRRRVDQDKPEKPRWR